VVPGSRAYTSAAEALQAQEIAVFSPDSRQPPGAGRATVVRAAASDPEPGSVSAMASVSRPSISGGR
jgi:hypothetical protein